VKNPYQKFPVTLEAIINETEDKNVKTFELHPASAGDAGSIALFAQGFQPGQFAMLWVPGYGEIPLGIASSPTENNKLLFSVNKSGKVTRHLHSLKRGALLGVRGPLGHGFPWRELQGRDLIFVGGGYAFTTLRSSIVYLLHPGQRGSFGEITLFYGARTPGMLMYKDELAQWSSRDDITVHLSVDAGAPADWKQHVGLIPSILAQQLAPAAPNAAVLLCGPPLMLKFSVLALRDKGYRSEQIYVSLENRMKCGIGHCGRCSIGGKCVCTDGPVFSLAEVDRLPEDY
jgi:NAD(P)H-flavin reductase